MLVSSGKWGIPPIHQKLASVFLIKSNSRVSDHSDFTKIVMNYLGYCAKSRVKRYDNGVIYGWCELNVSFYLVFDNKLHLHGLQMLATFLKYRTASDLKLLLFVKCQKSVVL